ncbi:MAG: hypothetical protein DRJ49_06280 [Thermoprotei archaeon]|nr:MAG: hypothetical protein DRJ49_06280 [Thermoprotei archaeon]
MHRIYYGGSADEKEIIKNNTGNVLAFSCIMIFHDKFYIMISHSDNPTPADFLKFQHQDQVNFPTKGVNFTLESLGNPLQPNNFRLYGPFENGYVNLTGYVVAYWPPKGWYVNKNTWWDSKAKYTWEGSHKIDRHCEAR